MLWLRCEAIKMWARCYSGEDEKRPAFGFRWKCREVCNGLTRILKVIWDMMSFHNSNTRHTSFASVRRKAKLLRLVTRYFSVKFDSGLKGHEKSVNHLRDWKVDASLPVWTGHLELHFLYRMDPNPVSNVWRSNLMAPRGKCGDLKHD